jgi:hypothetical protein
MNNLVSLVSTLDAEPLIPSSALPLLPKGSQVSVIGMFPRINPRYPDAIERWIISKDGIQYAVTDALMERSISADDRKILYANRQVVFGVA